MLVEDAILFLIKADAAEAIAAAEAVFAELAVATVGAVLAIVGHVAVGAVDTFRAPLAAETECETATADTFAGVTRVVHVFGIENTEAVVTIL